MIILGVDYGADGAFALVDSDMGDVLIYDMPKEGTEVDPVAIQKWLANKCTYARDKAICDAIYIEDVIANGPKAGKKGLLKQGKNIGKAEAVLILFSVRYDIPIVPISAQRWQRFQGLWGKSKEGAIETAIAKYPQAKDDMYGPKGGKKDGRADALLIADYGVKNYEKTNGV